MSDDDLRTSDGESSTRWLDFDEAAIASLLDTFVETQTGPQVKRVSRASDPSDIGARAAHRTVFQHRSRSDRLPLVGDAPKVKKRRVALLEALAERAVGSSRARLLSSAGELLEQLGENEAATRIYEAASSADARDVVVLRALRRIAMARDDWAAAANALQKEAGLSSGPQARASALELLSQIQRSKLGDPAAAEQSAFQAAELRDDGFPASILLASARLARGDAAGASSALSAAAEGWPIEEAQATIFLHAAEVMEDAGELEAARDLFFRVVELQPSLLDARLGLVRTLRGLGDPRAAIDALIEAAERSTDRLAAALRRTAAGLSTATAGSVAALPILEQAHDPASRWTLAETAALSGDLAGAADAFTSESADASPELAAVSSARSARLYAELDQSGGFEKAANAARVEPGLHSYLQAARRLQASDAEDDAVLDRGFDMAEDDPTRASSRMARTDELARSGNDAEFLSFLERELEQMPEDLIGGAALAIAETANASGIADRLDALVEAEQRRPDHPMINRALLAIDGDPDRGARRWTREGRRTTGDRSAFAFTMAARLGEPESEEALRSCENALEQARDYWPALWEMEDRLGSTGARAASAAAQAEHDPERGGSHMLRASLWTPVTGDRLIFAKSAQDRGVSDPLLDEHLFEAAGRNTESAGELMELASRPHGSVSDLERAAAAYRASKVPSRAAKVLREASLWAPDDLMVRVQRKHAEMEACEFARLADSAMRRARQARTEAEELSALSAMVEVDRLTRRDMQSARLSLQRIAEIRPGHVPTARALEWDALRENDTDRIRSSARRLVEALPSDSADRLARQRLSLEVLRSDPDILRSDLDRVLCNVDGSLEADPGLAREVLGAAYALGESSLAVRALLALQSSLQDDLERGALSLEAALVLQRMGDTERALDILDSAQNHPLARETEARLLHAAKRWDEAASAYRDAAAQARDSHRAASLWREAACILEEQLDDGAGAVDAWIAASDCDIRYLDVYRRLATLYRRRGQLDELAALTEQRISAGADTPTLAALLIEKARLRRERGDFAGVTEALLECLELDTHHFAALKELVDTHRMTEDWQGATDALIRIARLDRSEGEQTWAFAQLGEIYDVHLHDLPRAEASLRRVIKLDPTHRGALDRLASVLSRENDPRGAAGLLERLVRQAASDVEERDYRIRLAAAVESSGRAKQAELMLEELRSARPTDPDVILAVADYYQRQGAAPAEAMHLNRALSDLRAAIETDPGSESLWTTLVRVLLRRHGRGPASCAASAAIAIGHPASLFEGDVTAHGEALGEPSIPLAAVVDSIVAPSSLPHTLRRLFVLCEHSFDKALPFDANAWRLRRPSGPQRDLVEEAGDVAEALGISEPRLKITDVAPAACMPVSGDPLNLVVGGRLLEIAQPRERVFLFARALKIASHHLAPALRARPEELDRSLRALLQGHEAGRARQTEPRETQELRKKLLRAVPRRWRDEVDSLVLELRGISGFSTRSVPLAISELGNRAALVLTGDVPSAVNALLKIAGHEVPPTDASRLGAILETPEAWGLLLFAISDAHFEARAQAGVDR